MLRTLSGMVVSIIVRSGSILKRASGSVFCLILLLLVSTDAFVRHVKPLRYLDGLKLTGLNQSPAVAKLIDYLDCPANPEMIVLGSSLVLVPAARCDDEMNNKPARYDRSYYFIHVVSYDRADCFQRLLSRSVGRNVDLANLAVSGAMVSDYYLVLKKAIAAGKRPRVVMCALAPRDFLDNWRSKVEQTYTYQVLADLDCLGDVLANTPSLTSVGEFLPGMIWHYYRHRTDYRSALVAVTCKSLNRSRDLYSAIADRDRARNPQRGNAASPSGDESSGDPRKDSVPNYRPPANRLRDIAEYKRYYLPVNYESFGKQSEYLEKLLTLADKHNIRVVLLDMPLRKENLALLPEDIRKSYRSELDACAHRHGVKLVRLGDHEVYGPDDFEDSCHLNAAGGRKLFSTMAASAAESLASR